METETNGKVGEIYGLMTQINKEVEAIGKGRRNAEQNYAFRGIDDVYNMLHPLFAKYGVFTLPRVLSEESAERPTRSGGIMRFSKLTMAYDFFAADGSHVTVETVGEAMDTADKASNKAMSAAHKYGLLQTFCIPTGSTPDADFNTPEDVVGDPRPTSKSSTAQQNCPKCEGAMWDNRESKRNPKAPDYKCKNKSCDGAVWLKADAGTSDQVLRDQFFEQAEKYMILRKLPEDSRKDALGRLVRLSTEEMGQAVAKLVSGGNGKQETAPQRSSILEQKRVELANKIRADFKAEDIEKELATQWKGATLDSLVPDALEQLYSDLIPF